MKQNIKELIHELKHHSPFTLIATVLAILIIILIKFILNLSFEKEAFEILHPIHIIASAMVSAGIFYKYKKNFFQAIGVGIFSAILIGSLSDILLPYITGFIFNFEISFHFPLIEKPLIILGTAIFGSILGTITKLTKLPHLTHVGLSIFASLFYLMAFTQNFEILHFVISIIIVFIAVLIPCCVSDILLPFFFLGKKIKACRCKY